LSCIERLHRFILFPAKSFVKFGCYLCVAHGVNTLEMSVNEQLKKLADCQKIPDAAHHGFISLNPP
jgi:hypothetical protein